MRPLVQKPALTIVLAFAACAGGEGGPVSNPDAPVIDAEVKTDGAAAAPHGLRAEYFALYSDLVLERIEPTVDRDWGTGEPNGDVGPDHFSVRWTGSVVAPTTGSYNLIVDSDDGVRVWLGAQRVIDDWHAHTVTRNQAQVQLTAGMAVPIRIDYFELDMAASIRLSWSSGTIAEQVVPAENLVPAAAASGLEAPKPPYTNPVIPFDCPDPGVITPQDTGGRDFAMVCTGGRFPIRLSRDLVIWHDSGVALLPDGKAPWAANGDRNWAPEIHKVGNQFVAYFASPNASNVMSVGAVYAPSVLGTWMNMAGPLSQYPTGDIDPNFFEDDDGSRWLLYKLEPNSTNPHTRIFLRRLNPDGLSFADIPTEVLENDATTWEQGVVEAPWLIKRDGMYYLFYSGSPFDNGYRTGVARASVITGPYTKHGAPILADNETWIWPGHGSVVHVGAFDYHVYHAWQNGGNGQPVPGTGRLVLVDRVFWENGWPRINDGTPSHTPQPRPGESE